ncbi:MAG: hypothetical protein ABJO67_02515 [Pseudoruegeria sp.]
MQLIIVFTVFGIFILKLSILTTIMCFALTGAATAEALKCEVTNARNRGWVPSEIIVDFDRKSGDVIVVDPITYHFMEGPVAGEVAESSKKDTYKWSIKNAKDSHGQKFSLNYRMTVRKPSMKMNITGQPLGFQGPFTGKGKCAPYIRKK